MTTDIPFSLLPPQHKQFVIFNVEMLGKNEESSVISEILMFLRILRFSV